ncbi:MAG TPA: hypothetical protein VI391_08955, partial [Thermoanaerobaculia bacterium]
MRLASAVIVTAVLSTPVVASTFSFTPINVPGAGTTVASGINNQGQIVGAFVSATGNHGFLDEDGAFTTFDVPGT